MPLHTCSRFSKITNCRFFPLRSSADLIWYIYQKVYITPVPLPTPSTYTQTHALEKRSSSTLDLLFKIQALVKKKRQKRRKKPGDIRPDIKEKFDFIDVT